MKPLTIEELKTLEVGDWVWVIDINELGRTKGTYREIYDIIGDEVLLCGNVYGMRRYTDYGTKWIAYKNKEQAEAKGEIVELPRIEPFITFNIESGEPITCYNILYRDMATGELIIDCEGNKSIAEARLKELKNKEKKK